MTGQTNIHCPLDQFYLARVLSKNNTCHCFNTGPNAGAVCRYIGMTPGSSFSPAGYTGVGFKLDERGIEYFELQSATRKPVGIFKWQVFLINRDFINFHRLVIHCNDDVAAVLLVYKSLLCLSELCQRITGSEHRFYLIVFYIAD